MSTIQQPITRFSDLFTPGEVQHLDQAGLRANGFRHPTWFALHNHKPRAVDSLVHTAIPAIVREPGGEGWLRDLAPRLNDFEDDRNASSSLAEIRAYGGLLEAGFKVSPILRKTSATPDFTVDAGDGLVTVEVFSKHQDKEQDELVSAATKPNGEHPYGIERSTAIAGELVVHTTMIELTPGGWPNPMKPDDSVHH